MGCVVVFQNNQEKRIDRRVMKCNIKIQRSRKNMYWFWGRIQHQSCIPAQWFFSHLPFFNLLSLGRFSPKTRGLPTAWVISAKGEPWWATFQKVKKIVTPSWQYVENAKNIWVYHGLSGTSIPQNPMVNHHFPWTCHFFGRPYPISWRIHPSWRGHAGPCWAMR